MGLRRDIPVPRPIILRKHSAHYLAYQASPPLNPNSPTRSAGESPARRRRVLAGRTLPPPSAWPRPQPAVALLDRKHFALKALPHPNALAWASQARRLFLAGAGAPARSFHAQPYQAKVGVVDFLNGMGKGVETHAAKLDQAVGGDLQWLLETRTLRLKKLGLLGIPCKHQLNIICKPPTSCNFTCGTEWTKTASADLDCSP